VRIRAYCGDARKLILRFRSRPADASRRGAANAINVLLLSHPCRSALTLDNPQKVPSRGIARSARVEIARSRSLVRKPFLTL
jgi:hypothetical protein